MDGLNRKPVCPRCDRNMIAYQSWRDHWFWRCSQHGEIFGIVGQPSFYGTKRLVDPVTLKIVDR